MSYRQLRPRLVQHDLLQAEFVYQGGQVTPWSSFLRLELLGQEVELGRSAFDIYPRLVYVRNLGSPRRYANLGGGSAVQSN